jgi:hypothetical protein
MTTIFMAPLGSTAFRCDQLRRGCLQAGRKALRQQAPLMPWILCPKRSKSPQDPLIRGCGQSAAFTAGDMCDVDV